MKRALLLVVLCVYAANLYAQTSAVASAGSGLITQLSKGLAISPTQAKGGAGTLFSLAKSRLTENEFSKVSSSVPNMGSLLKAAPPLTHQSDFSSLESELPGSMGSMGRMAEAAEAFHKLGLSPEMAGKFLPIMSKYVESRGGSESAGLLEKALK
jgi:hypothetical protein